MEREWAVADYGNCRFAQYCNRFSHSIGNRNQKHFLLLNIRAVSVICVVCLQRISRDQRFPMAWVNGFLHLFNFSFV